MTLGRADATAGNGDGEFHASSDVAVSVTGEIYVTDPDNSRIEKLDANGAFLNHVGGDWSSPKGIQPGSPGNLWVTDAGTNELINLSFSGIAEPIGPSGSALRQFQTPRHLAADFDSIYVADTGNNRIQKLTGGSSGADGESTPSQSVWLLGTSLRLAVETATWTTNSLPPPFPSHLLDPICLTKKRVRIGQTNWSKQMRGGESADPNAGRLRVPKLCLGTKDGEKFVVQATVSSVRNRDLIAVFFLKPLIRVFRSMASKSLAKISAD